MGNFPSAPRSRVVHSLRDDMEEDVRNLVRSLRTEADMNTRVSQQKYDRRERRYKIDRRPNRHVAHRDRSRSDDSMRGDQYYTAPEPQHFDPRGIGNPDYSPPRGRSGKRRGPPKVYGGRPQYAAARDEPGLAGDDLEDVDYDARDSADPYAGLHRQGQVRPEPRRPQRSPGEPDHQ
ncbi:MAG: hypothetical protein Q9209_000293 [Squamulea sp. 1 TL-2023]